MTSPEQKPLVLVVDDDPGLLDLMRVMLESNDFAVHTVLDGKQALDWLEDNMPDAIILDIMMPKVDGFAVLRAVRSDERTGLMPVIMLSARVDQEAKEQSKHFGADAYFSKPAPITKLLEELREQLRRNRGEQAADTGPIEVD